ncbi:MAG: BlaI/MecI/CopY family transcriptional regulator [Clostridiales bacterium]|nr:BlaI/MecI/CopY family transcriptional regulator [Clostridiales bacterium]
MSEMESAFSRLPDAELDVMLAVWRCEAPVTTARVAVLLPEARNWKTATLISFLSRLEKRGFLRAEKEGREYVYTPLVDRNEYLGNLTRDFISRVHGGSIGSMLDALFGKEPIPDEVLDGLLSWLEGRR